MLTWPELREVRPDLAEAGHRLFYAFGVGLAFIGTLRADGAPRVNPMCPILTPGGLFAFLIPSRKRDDLLRDGRYAMHGFPMDDNEDAFSIAGLARPLGSPSAHAELAAQYLAEREWSQPPPRWDEQEVFEFLIDRCLHTVTTGHGDPNPVHEVWRAS